MRLKIRIYSDQKLTHKVLQGPWFFLGHLVVWWLATIADPQGLIDLAKDSTDPNGTHEGLAGIMGTKAGASAAWAHMWLEIFLSQDGCGRDSFE